MSQGYSKGVAREGDLVLLPRHKRLAYEPEECLDQMSMDQRLYLPPQSALKISPCWTFITLLAPGYTLGYTRSIHRRPETYQERPLHFKCPGSIWLKIIEPVISHRCVDASRYLRVREK